jgi:hypothetical protein
MHFIIRGEREKLPTDPKLRKAAVDAWDEAQSLPLKEAAKRRRDYLKEKRYADLALRPDLVEKRIEQMRAVRRSMEKRING